MKKDNKHPHLGKTYQACIQIPVLGLNFGQTGEATDGVISWIFQPHGSNQTYHLTRTALYFGDDEHRVK